MKYSDWRYEINLVEFVGAAPVVGGVAKGIGLKALGAKALKYGWAAAIANTLLNRGKQTTKTITKTATKVAGQAIPAVQKVGKAISGREKTDSQKRIIKTGGIKAARDRDGDGKLEKYNKTSGDYSEALLYDVVHDYIIAENFASDTEGANKVML